MQGREIIIQMDILLLILSLFSYNLRWSEYLIDNLIDIL